MAANQEEIKQYYNDYTQRQKNIGVNQRHKSILRFLLENGLKKESNVLEIGCGIGTQSGLILKNISSKGSLTSCDISDKSIEIAKENNKNYSNAKFQVLDVTEAEIDGNYDVIVLPDVIEHIPMEKHPMLFNNLRKVIKNNGFMLIHIPYANFHEWLHKNKPESLQIIDQPIHLDFLSANLRKSGFMIEKVKTYSIFTKPYDYQLIIAKPLFANMAYEDIVKKVTFIDKIKYKLNHFGK